MFFIGDFNFTEESILHTMMTNILALNDVHQQYVLDNPDLSIEDRNGYTNGRSTKRIDYIWASPELYGRSIKVIMKERLYKNEPLSDHMAVIGTIEY